MKPKQTEKNETDILDTLYLDFLGNYEKELSYVVDYIQMYHHFEKRPSVTGNDSGQRARIEGLKYHEGQAAAIYYCLKHIKALKEAKENKDL